LTFSERGWPDNSTGNTWFEAMSNGASAGWHQVGGSDTHYSVVGVGDFFESGVDDILFRNNSTGDTWIEQMTNAAGTNGNPDDTRRSTFMRDEVCVCNYNSAEKFANIRRRC
jgi:hypothetical protein